MCGAPDQPDCTDEVVPVSNVLYLSGATNAIAEGLLIATIAFFQYQR